MSLLLFVLCEQKNFSITKHLLSFLSYKDYMSLILACKTWRNYFQKNFKLLEAKIFKEQYHSNITQLIFQEVRNSPDILWYATNIFGWIMSAFSIIQNYIISYNQIPKDLKKYYLLERAFIAFGDSYKISIDNITYFCCPNTKLIQINHKKTCKCCLEDTQTTSDPFHLIISYDEQSFNVETFLCIVCSLQ